MIKNMIKTTYRLSTQFGVDPRQMVRSFEGLPRFILNWLHFRKLYKGRLDIYPCLHDWFEEGGATKGEYFWQDLHIARKIFLANPIKHVDIGSRIDGFVAHVASYREVEMFDIRPVKALIPGVVIRQADLMNDADSFVDYCDSITCLHALEHFGLGRYGDPISPYGYKAGLINMAKILRSGGVFYLSVPIGIERVEFNAHRIFNPLFLVQLAKESKLELKEFSWIKAGELLIHSVNIEQDMTELSGLIYALGIFTFVKD